MDIKPIKTEQDYTAALDRLGELWGAPLDTPEGDELDILATLIGAYEDEHHEIEAPNAIEAILFRMDQMGLTRKDLEPMIGHRGRVSDIMTGTRTLTLPMIRRLHEGLQIPAHVLIAE